MERKFVLSNMNKENKENENEEQHILQIKKYDNRSQIFNDNDSFIAIEEQAMREAVENEVGNNSNSNNQEFQNEIEQLKIERDEALDEKENALSQLASKDFEIEKLNNTIQDLKIELQRSEDKNAALNKQFIEQRDLNSDLSLRLQELTEALSDKNKNADSNININSQPDQLIYRTRALELQLATLKNENDQLKEEIETREKNFISELTRLTEEISNAHSENSNPKSLIISKTSKENLLESEIAALRIQLDKMTESQKSLSDSLQHEIDTNGRLNSQLSAVQENLEKNIDENANTSSIIKTLLEMTHLSNPFDLIINVRRLQIEKNEAQQARQQLCQLQVTYDKEVIVNEKLRKEISDLKDTLLEEMHTKSREVLPETSEPSFDQNFINELKSEYESRLNAERARTLSQKKKIDAIKFRDRQIAEKFSSIPDRDHTDIIQSLITLFESLSSNSNTIGDGNDDEVEGANDHLLDEAIEQTQNIALTLVPHDFLIHDVDKMQSYQKYLNEIFAKIIKLSDQIVSLEDRIKRLEEISKRNNRFQRLSRPPISRFTSKNDVTINRNGNNISSHNNGNGDSTFNFNLNPNHSSLSFSRSPVASGSTPKSGARRIPFTEKGNHVSPLASKWKPRSGPSNEFGQPMNPI